jgi:hypothetical protein
LPLWVELEEGKEYDIEAFIYRVSAIIAWWAGRITNEEARELLELDPEVVLYDFMVEHVNLAMGVVEEYKEKKSA